MIPFIVVTLLFQVARAEETESDKRNKQKISDLSNYFNKQTNYSKQWQYGWLSVFLTNSVVDGIRYSFAKTQGEKYARKLSLMRGSLGIIDILINPLYDYSDIGRFRLAKESSPDLRRSKLLIGEDILHHIARRETIKTSMITHISGVLLNLTGAYLIGVKKKMPKDAYMFLLGGILGSELTIYTAPDSARIYWKNYQEKYTDYKTIDLEKRHSLKITLLPNMVQVSHDF